MTDKELGEFIGRLQTLTKNDDYEAVHSDADRILCEMLTKLGYQEVVDIYHTVGKWYA